MASSLKFRGAFSSSSSSSSSHQWTYDVFLSFSGEDTRKNFTGYLYDALDRNGVKTFIDDEQLGSGDKISSAFLKAIEESRISIVVFSRNYASSAWCLDELTKIFECREKKKQMVVPVFYGVNPLDVRYQRGIIAKSFVGFEEWSKDHPVKVERWKAVLRQVSDLAGWHLDDYRDEAAVIHEIVQFITNYKNLQVAKQPIGIEFPVQEHDLPSSPSSVGIASLVQQPDLSNSPSQAGIESPVQEPHLSSSPSQVGMESTVQEPHLSSSTSPVRIESPVQEPHLSELPSGNGEQGSNSSISSQGAILVLIGSVFGLLQLNDLFETHPANMWTSEAALIIFCLSYATMTKINGTRWARHSQIIDRFRILSGTLVAVSLLSIPLPHQLSWLFYVIWAFLVFIVVVCTWICPEEEVREVEIRIPLLPL